MMFHGPDLPPPGHKGVLFRDHWEAARCAVYVATRHKLLPISFDQLLHLIVVAGLEEMEGAD